MKILFLYSYFKPEHTSGAHLAEDLREGLAANGHVMEVYTPTPSRGVSDEERKVYKTRKNETDLNGSLQIHRFWLYREGKNTILRAVRYFILELQLFYWGLKAKDVNILPLGSTPPINGLLGILLKKIKGIPYVYTVQDVFPDSLVNTGMTHEGSLLWKIGNWISNITYKHASHIIVINESMKQNLLEKGVPEEKISVVYNWIDTEKVHPIDRNENTLFDELGIDREKFIVTYAGNLGNSQNVELLLDCAEQLSDYADITFVVFGEGTQKDKLMGLLKKRGLNNLNIYPLQSGERVSEVYSLGDVSAVLAKKGVGKSAFPSKAVSIMACGTPILASFDIDSDLCTVIKNENVGIACIAENPDAVVQAILDLYHNKEICRTLGRNGRQLACSFFSKKVCLAKKIQIIEKFSKCL